MTSTSTPPASRQHIAPHADLALPPETLEGWYALHQIFRISRPALRRTPAGALTEIAREAEQRLASWASVEPSVGEARAAGSGGSGGWSAAVTLMGGQADVMLMHFRASLDAIGDVQRQWAATALAEHLEPVYTFLSVTEAGLYHITAAVARERLAAGGEMGDDESKRLIAARVDAERASPHVMRRLYPAPPADMPYVCFYPMSKRRGVGQNWYALSLDERSRLMYAHGLTGRRYTGKIMQVITGAIGLDAWEWGVTLFGRDPLDFKKLVTDMRFDEVSARYAEFGQFYVGRLSPPSDWVSAIIQPSPHSK